MFKKSKLKKTLLKQLADSDKTVFAPLPEAELTVVTGGMRAGGGGHQSSWTDPSGPDDIYRIDD